MQKRKTSSFVLIVFLFSMILSAISTCMGTTVAAPTDPYNITQITDLTVQIDGTYARDPIEWYNLTITLKTPEEITTQTIQETIRSRSIQSFVTEISESNTLILKPDSTSTSPYWFFFPTSLIIIVILVELRKISR